jgi:phosphotransferase system  glucose/maltose/N-acetylglucosamine-specific IIC component
VWFNFGDYSVIENGVDVIKHGDLWRFYAGDKSAGIFMAGMFPVMMFGLPAACIAMILCVKPEKRKAGKLVLAVVYFNPNGAVAFRAGIYKVEGRASRIYVSYGRLI